MLKYFIWFIYGSIIMIGALLCTIPVKKHNKNDIELNNDCPYEIDDEE